MESDGTCFFCLEPLKYRVLLPCDHNSLCLNCYIRDTRCYHHNQCYYCQKPLVDGHPIIVINDSGDTKYAVAKAKKPYYDQQYQLFYFDKFIHDYIISLFHFTCQECKLVVSAFDVFAAHVKIHRMRVCQICFSSNRFLPGDLPVFRTVKEYQLHFNNQHPRCPCCENHIVFDQDILAKHMLEKHHRCEVCAHSEQQKVLWFKDAQSLVAHHEKFHFTCHYPQCSSENLIAFATRGELMIHLQTVHNEKFQSIDLADFANDNNRNSSSQGLMSSSNSRNPNGPSENGMSDSAMRKKEMNRKFMQRLNEVLQEQDKLQLMKCARQFIMGKVSGDVFYRNFAAICKGEKDALFNDMVSFLPLPEKRAELVRIHVQFVDSNIPQPPKQPSQNPTQQQIQIQQNQQQNQLENDENNYNRNENRRRGGKNKKKKEQNNKYVFKPGGSDAPQPPPKPISTTINSISNNDNSGNNLDTINAAVKKDETIGGVVINDNLANNNNANINANINENRNERIERNQRPQKLVITRPPPPPSADAPSNDQQQPQQQQQMQQMNAQQGGGKKKKNQVRVLVSF